MQSEIIRTEALTKRYGERLAVDQLSFAVEHGEIFGFLGPNGAGKTTTIAMLLGLVRPTSGSAWLFGHNVQADLPAALARVGAMIEAPAFYPYLSAAENLQTLAALHRLPKARIAEVLAIVGLSARARDRVGKFSQGMRQRLAIAAALIHQPELIILDEPTNGLDPAGTVEIRDLIRELAANGHTVLLCSHLLHEVEQLCGRVAILKQGRLIAQGRVSDLLGAQGLELTVEGPHEPVLALLATLPEVRRAENRSALIYVEADPAHAALINRALAQAGVLVSSLRPHRNSLEEVFLELTEQAP